MVQSPDTIYSGLTVIVTAISVVVAGIAIKVQQYYAKKQSDREALLDVFEMINNDTHKNAESALLENFRNNALYNVGIMHEHLVRSSATPVWRNYDQIGLLIKRGLIPKSDFFYMFGKIAIIQHWILFQEINRRRLNGEIDFMINFTRVAIDCYYYWKGKGENRVPREPITNTVIQETVIKQWQESLPTE